MDCILLNGNVISMDGADSRWEAVGISNGLIAAAGSSADLKAQAGPKTEVIDLKGRTVLPGFTDSHNHLMIFGYLLSAVNCSTPPNMEIADILNGLRERAQTTPPGMWVNGWGYTDYKLKEHRAITRRDLDTVTTDHPIVLYHISYHSCVLNSPGLKEFNITRETPDPEGGEIVRDETGEPNGILHDNAMMHVFHTRYNFELDNMSPEERINVPFGAAKKYAEVGVTAAHDALVTPTTLRIYQEALQADKLPVRVNTMNLHETAGPMLEAGVKFRFGNHRLRIGPIKIFYDGGMSCRTAYVSQPYEVPPYSTGIRVMEPEKLTELVTRFHNVGYQIAIHSQGDAALKETLDAYETVLGKSSSNPLRHRIEHAGALFGELIARVADMNIMIASQPCFFSDLADGWIEAFGDERAKHLYPFKSLIDRGVVIGGSSDSPVSIYNPLVGIRDAVLRRTGSGQPIGPDERLDIRSAVRMFTTSPAKLSFDEGFKGTVEAGKWADLVVLQEDPFGVKPEEISDIPVDMTIMGGRVTHLRERSGI